MSEPARDEARFTRPWFLPGVELVSVTYRERSFPEHSHAEWVFGAILSGAEKLVVNGIAHVVNAGQILRLHPDEPHANHTFDARTLRYRVAYISDDALEPYLDKTHVGRGFPTPVLDDATIHSTVVGAHVLLSRDDVGRLEQESALAALTYALFADVSSHIPEARPSQSAVTVARTYIDDHFAEGFGLATLAEAAGLSVFHLARTFRQSVGLSPLAYRNQRRLVEAKRLLLSGRPIADVALDVGYADQSHLTRQFQRIVGVSPKRYLAG